MPLHFRLSSLKGIRTETQVVVKRGHDCDLSITRDFDRNPSFSMYQLQVLEEGSIRESEKMKVLLNLLEKVEE